MRAEPAFAARLRSAGLDWIVPDWPAPSTVRAFSTTRNGVAGSAVDFSRNTPDAAAARALLRRFAPAEPLWLAQVHGAAIVSADESHGRAPAADGAVSRVDGKVCAVLTADCLPVLLTDRRGTVVSAAHAGWRGLASGVLESAVRSTQAEPADLLAGVRAARRARPPVCRAGGFRTGAAGLSRFGTGLDSGPRRLDLAAAPAARARARGDLSNVP